MGEEGLPFSPPHLSFFLVLSLPLSPSLSFSLLFLFLCLSPAPLVPARSCSRIFFFLISLMSLLLSLSLLNPSPAILRQVLAAVALGGNIYTSSNPAGDGNNNWALRRDAGARQWVNIGMNAAGTKLAANAFGNYIYTSTVSFCFVLLFSSFVRERIEASTLPKEKTWDSRRADTFHPCPRNSPFSFPTLKSFFISTTQQDGGIIW